MNQRATMKQSRPPSPTPSRSLGLVGRVDTRERGFIFIINGDQEYFAHRSAFETRGLFDRVQQGDGVSFRVARTGKGFRAFDVRLAEGSEIERLQEMEESRGNA